PVYAHGASNQPWLEVGRPHLNGRVASIPLVVPSVPALPGETLTAKVLVRANGNQRFVVPVTLVVGTTLADVFAFDLPPAVVAAPPAPVTPVPARKAAPAPAPVAHPRAGSAAWLHAVPAVLLALVLGGLLGLDIAQRVSRGPGEPVEFSEDTTSF